MKIFFEKFLKAFPKEFFEKFLKESLVEHLMNAWNFENNPCGKFKKMHNKMKLMKYEVDKFLEKVLEECIEKFSEDFLDLYLNLFLKEFLKKPEELKQDVIP